MKTALLYVLALVGVASAARIPRAASAPSVTIENGTLIGQNNGTVENFIGIPFAQPPVGPLRLKPPQSIVKPFGTLELPTVATGCIAQNSTAINMTGIPKEAEPALMTVGALDTYPQSEDCLNINVQRPAGTTSDAKLPVLLWIFGGGFASGATSEFSGQVLVNQSISMATPMIYVAPNYRLNAFGFLPGKQLMEDGSTNLGLRDQRMALEWVSENIAAFGGDPDRVTIMGESAGAISVFDHLVINGGDNTYKGKPLFRGAIMDSGSVVRTLPVDSCKAQGVFDNVAAAAGCGPANTSDVLDCLRAAPVETLAAAQQEQPNFLGYTANDLAFLPRPDPSDIFFPLSPQIPLARGDITRVPLIMTDQEDEGTIFSLAQRNLSTTDDVVDFFTAWYTGTDEDVVRGFVALYPDDAAAGAPFGTGAAYELYPQYKRNAAIQTDVIFNGARREVLSTMACQVPTWTYLATYEQDLPQLGTYHTSDLGEIFSHKPLARPGEIIDAYYVNFATSGNPNGAGQKHWPKWSEFGLQMLNISATNVTYIRDDYRWASFEYLATHPESFYT